MPGAAFGGGAPVTSVNGEIGVVVIDAADVDAQPESANLTTLSAVTPGALGLADLAVVAPVNNPASPYAVAAGVRRITTNASLTVQLPTTAVTVGEIVSVTNNSAVAITVTFTAASIDGTTSVAISVPARGAAGAQLVSAAVWGSVQPGASGGADFVTTSIYPYDETAFLGPNTTPAGSFVQAGTIGGP